jgi:hypothetical protein
MSDPTRDEYLKRLAARMNSMNDQMLADFRRAVEKAFGKKAAARIGPRTLVMLNTIYIPIDPTPRPDLDDIITVEGMREEQARFLRRSYPALRHLYNQKFGDDPDWLASDLNLPLPDLYLFLFRNAMDY